MRATAEIYLRETPRGGQDSRRPCVGGPSRRRSTPTCSTPTTTWPQELDLRMRVAARQLATARVLDAQAGRVRPGPVVQRRRRRARPAGPRRPARGPHPHRRPHRHRAARRRRPAAAPAPRASTTCSSATATWRALMPPRASRCWTRSSPSGSGRGRRSRTRCCDARSAAPTISTLLRAISCQPRLEVRLALLLWHLAARWGRVEPAASASRCRSPTGCSASWSAPSGRRSRTRSAACRAPASSPATPATGTCTGRSTSHLAALIERTDEREASGAPTPAR